MVDKINKINKIKLDIENALKSGDPNLINKEVDNNGNTLLHLACKHNLVDHVRLLLDDERTNPNIEDFDNWTPFHYAVCTSDNDIKIFMLFYECPRVSLTICTGDNLSPLILVCRNSWTPNAETIIDTLLNDPKTDPNILSSEGTAFHILCKNKYNNNSAYFRIIQKFLDNLKINIMLQDRESKTPFMTVCWYGSLPLVKLLIDDPRNEPNFKDRYGRTAFSYACCSTLSPCNEVIQFLIDDYRIDVNLADNKGLTPFAHVCKACYETKIDILLSNDRIDKTKPDNNNVHPLVHALGDRLELIKSIVKYYGEDELLKVLKN